MISQSENFGTGELVPVRLIHGSSKVFVGPIPPDAETTFIRASPS